MIPRALDSILRQRLAELPAVALTGPRQVGKTTLALQYVDNGAIYLDLESGAQRIALRPGEAVEREALARLGIADPYATREAMSEVQS